MLTNDVVSFEQPGPDVLVHRCRLLLSGLVCPILLKCTISELIAIPLLPYYKFVKLQSQNKV